MTNEEAIKQIKSLGVTNTNSTLYKALDLAIKALEQQPCEDCISRQDVVDFIIDNYGVGFTSLTNGIRDYLPSITPQRPKGKWIRITNGAMREKYICSECGRQIEEDGIEELITIKYPYCHCGAEMSGGDEDEDGD